MGGSQPFFLLSSRQPASCRRLVLPCLLYPTCLSCPSLSPEESRPLTPCFLTLTASTSFMDEGVFSGLAPGRMSQPGRREDLVVLFC